jgi:hypothetical protein
MPVDVRSEIEIRRLRAEVCAYAPDPDNAMAWYENIEAVEWRSPRPLAVGSEIAFVARFLDRRLAYTYEVMQLVPGERFVMSTAMRRANRKDLARLKAILEARSPTT